MAHHEKTPDNILTPRQRQILELVAQRRSSKEIARELMLSPATVDSHVAAILAKLGVATRRDAVIWLMAVAGNTADRSIHHGEVSLVGQPPWYLRIFKAKGLAGQSPAPDRSLQTARSGMGTALLRFVVDAFYVVLFFATLAAAAYGVDKIVHFCEERAFDIIVVYILKGISYALVAIDGIGVVSAASILTYRFILAIIRTGSNNDE
jgi:DNA-binding CsgD family transcriptional regulator